MSHTVSAQVDIKASIDEVWRLMVDLESYGRWNDFVIRIDGPKPVREGSHLRLHARMLPGIVVHPRVKVTALAPPSDGEAALVYEVVGLMAAGVEATRTQTVVATGEHRCRYTTREVFEGPLAALIPLERVQRGTRIHADGLKRAAEP